MKNLQFLLRGITLIEVLVTLAIVGILTVAVVPLYRSYIEASRVKGSAEGLYQALVLARTEAVKRQADVVMVIQAGTNWCYGLTTGSSCDCQSAGSCDLGQDSYSNYSGVSLSLTTITSPVTFDGYRGLVSPVGTVSFTSSAGEQVSISINSAGLVKICSDNVGGYEPC